MFLSSHLSLKKQTLTFENSTPSMPLTLALLQKKKKKTRFKEAPTVP